MIYYHIQDKYQKYVSNGKVYVNHPEVGWLVNGIFGDGRVVKSLRKRR